MPLARGFADSLVCPKCKQRLVYFEADQFLLCRDERLRYPIANGVPVLLVDEAEAVSAEDANRLMKLAKEQGLTGG
jgi:uncharacterized protein